MSHTFDFINCKDDDKQVAFEDLETDTAFVRTNQHMRDHIAVFIKIDEERAFNLTDGYMSSFHPRTKCLPVRLTTTVEYII